MDDIPETDLSFVLKIPEKATPELDVHRLTELARALAVNLQPETEILARFGITPDHLVELRKNAFFANCLENFTQEWNSPLTTAQRMKIKSAMILEDSLPTLANRMTNEGEPLRDSIEAAKLFAKMGDIGEQKNGVSTGERVSITINIGEHTEKYEKLPVIDVEATSTGPLSPNTKGESCDMAGKSLTNQEESSPKISGIPEGNSF